jgi:hypothetical protein
MIKEEILAALEKHGFRVVNPHGGLGCPDGTPEPRLQRDGDGKRPGSLYVCNDRLRATGRYAERLSATVPPSHKDTLHGYPEWNGDVLERLLDTLPTDW